MPELVIPSSEGRKRDLLALGALVTRLDPGLLPFSVADNYQLHVSGGEYNVAANLSRCFGLRTAVASAMVDYPIGQKVEREVRASGVEGIYLRFAHDGVRGPNMATVWSDRGQGPRAPVVFYNRANEAAGQLGPGSFDWKRIFGEGLRWFHSGGIFSALSPTTPDLVIEAMKAAKAAGAVV
ncbi:MAG: sugar kinase, partial [Spirochaetota bacterium]